MLDGFMAASQAGIGGKVVTVHGHYYTVDAAGDLVDAQRKFPAMSVIRQCGWSIVISEDTLNAKKQDDQVAKEGDTIVITRMGSLFVGQKFTALSCTCVNKCTCSPALDKCAWFMDVAIKRWVAFGDYRVIKRNQSVPLDIKAVLNFLKSNNIRKVEIWTDMLPYCARVTENLKSEITYHDDTNGNWIKENWH